MTLEIKLNDVTIWQKFDDLNSFLTKCIKIVFQSSFIFKLIRGGGGGDGELSHFLIIIANCLVDVDKENIQLFPNVMFFA